MWKRTDRIIKSVETQKALFDKVKDFVDEEEIEVYKSKTLEPRRVALEKRFR